MRRQRSGFTLIEMLVALTLLTVVVVVVFISLSSVIRSTEMMGDLAKERHFRQVLQDDLYASFGTVYVDSACAVTEYAFLGENEDSGLGPADRVSFCTSQPMRGPYALPGLLKVVTYEVLEEGDGGDPMALEGDYLERKESVMLTITEEPLVLSSVDEERDTEEYADLGMSRQVPVHSFDVVYYDQETEEWVEEWDSMEVNRLPWAVWIRVNFARTEAELDGDLAAGLLGGDTADLDITIPLAQGMGTVDQFIDPNHLGTDLITDPDGIFQEDRRR